jgi:hypothetical protein
MRKAAAYLLNARFHAVQLWLPVSVVFVMRCAHISAFWFSCFTRCCRIDEVGKVVEVADCKACIRISRDRGVSLGGGVGVGEGACWSDC